MNATRLILGMILMLSAASAQAQLSVAIQMDPNPSPYISDWRSNPNTIRFIVTNTSRVEIPVRFKGFIEGDARGRVAETNLEAAVPPVMIPPQTTVTLNAVDVYLIEEGAVTYVGSTRNETRRSGRLPEDDFRMCVTLVTYDAPFNPLSPEVCTRFSVRLLQAPYLIAPADGSTVTASPAFQWTAVPMGRAQFAEYELTLIELDPGQDNIRNAMKTNLPLIVRTTSLPVYQYLASDPGLEKGHRYAWQVRASDPQGRYDFKDKGESEIWSFEYDPPVPPGFDRPKLTERGKTSLGSNININPQFFFGRMSSLSGRLKATWFKSRIPKARTVTVDDKKQSLKPPSSKSSTPSGQQNTTTQASQATQTGQAGQTGATSASKIPGASALMSMKDDTPMGGIHLRLYRRTRTDPLCGVYPYSHDGKWYEAEKLVATTTTNPDGTFQFTFLCEDSTGRILHNAHIICQSGDLFGEVNGDLYRYYQIEVTDPHLCSPSDEFKIQPGDAADVGDLFSLVRSYTANVEVYHAFGEDTFKLSGMNVSIIRGSRPFDVPANEGTLDPSEPTVFTKLGLGSSMIIARAETDPQGMIPVPYLAKNVGGSDFYQVMVTSPEEGQRYYQPAIRSFDFGFLMDERDEKGQGLKFDMARFNESYDPSQMHATVKVYATPKDPRISGVLYRKDNPGQPVTNTHVRLYRKQVIPLFVASCMTNDSGAFVFDDLTPTQQNTHYYMVVDKPGYKFLRKPLEYGYKVAKGQKKFFVLQLEPKLTVTGRLVDEFGRPIAGKVRIGQGSQVHTVKKTLTIPIAMRSSVRQRNPVIQESMVYKSIGPKQFTLKSKPKQIQITYAEEFTTPAVPGIRRMYITPDNIESYLSDELWILLPNSAEDIGEFTVYRKAHRLAVRALKVKPPSPGTGTNPKGGKPPSSAISPNQFSTTPPEYEPLLGARVTVNGMAPDSVDGAGVSYFVWFAAGDIAEVVVEGPEGSDYLMKELIVPVPDEKPEWYELDVPLTQGGHLAGTVRVGTVPIPNARVLLYDNPAETEPLTVFTDVDGKYELRSLPAGMHTFLAAKSKSLYIGDTARARIRKGEGTQCDFELKAYNDMDITHLLGFPIEVTEVDSSGGKVLLSGNFVNLPGNDQFSLEEPTATLSFENIVIVPSSETNANGLPLADPETLPLNTLADELDLEAFGHFIATQYDAVNGIHLTKAGDRGEVRGGVTVNPASFQFASGSLDFGSTQIALATDLVSPNRLTIPSLTSDNSAAHADERGFHVCMEDGGALQYTLYSFTSEVDSTASFFRGDTLILPTILHTEIGNIETADLAIDIGPVRAHHDNLEEVHSTQPVVIPLAGAWNMHGSSWTLDQNGFRLDSGHVDAVMVQVPFTGLQILPTQIEFGTYHLDHMSLSNTVEINFTGDPYFVYDVGTNDWKVGATPSTGENTCGYINALPGMKPTDKIFIESFYVKSSGAKNFQPYSGNSVTLYNVADYTIDQLYAKIGYIEVGGSLDLGIPNLPVVNLISTYAKEEGIVVFRPDPVIETISVNGVNIKFKSTGGDPAQWFDNTGYHANVDVYEEGAFRLASMLHRSPTKTDIIVNTGEEVPVGTVKMTDVVGDMEVVDDAWTLFWFEGDLINNNQGGRLKFTVQGDIVANDQEIGVDQISTPFGDISLVYNFVEQQLEGTLHVEHDLSGTTIVGDATLLISGAGKGWYFFCGASFTLPSPKVDGTAAFAVGDFLLTQKQLDQFASYSYNNAGLPPQFHDFNGFFFEGTVKFPPPVFCPNFEFDFGLVSAHLTCQVGANARFGMNFGTVNTYFIAMRAIGHLEAGIGASIGIACAGLKAGILIEPNIEGMYQSDGTWYVQGDFPITLYGETYAGWGLCDSDCCCETCDKESLSASITLGILGYVGSDDKYFKFYFK